ncbi:GNAT family N-acetyltransferase [Streptomyces cocklensis]|uniref:Acetyltransferase (GNAT) family protein n=1 Tax=Actinacidiphila cocklensis TaxID=887465 RepID=A0A9W4DU84_9ACTN|nr:GNAT family N-acetyltransferase [Actinacidiphila cocklensis]MDD1062103.1 GNAT family N-acetyltransferase [Actinacidiphila cocklensis]CAG6396350.1 Acetyltransferase (GNAT) family protein [Actinacidiphila cocklensis]
MSRGNAPKSIAESPRVRRRTDADLDACVRSLGEVHRGDGYPVNWPDRPAQWLAPPAQLAAWVAELDGRVVGHAGLSRSEEGDAAAALWNRRGGAGAGEAAVVGRLFVALAARGHGIGALLMAQVVAEAREHGLHPVLDVVASDSSAVALYERLGWELLGTVEQRWSPQQTVTVRCYAAGS